MNKLFKPSMNCRLPPRHIPSPQISTLWFGILILGFDLWGPFEGANQTKQTLQLGLRVIIELIIGV